MLSGSQFALGTAALAALTVPALAYVNTMYTGATDPSSYGSLVASLNITSTGWDFPVDQNELDQGKTNSGFKAEMLIGGGPNYPVDPLVNPNRTSLQTDVYSVTAPTVIPNGAGNMNLLPGDLVFAYRIRLVGVSSNAIDTLQEFGIGGLGTEFGGYGAFDSSIVLGRGYSVAGLSTPSTQFPVENIGDFEEENYGPGWEMSSLEFNWPFGNQSAQMGNGKRITLLVFARGATFTDGWAKFAGVSGQASQSTSTVANNAPVLIPVVPTPGASVLAIAAGVFASRRRR